MTTLIGTLLCMFGGQKFPKIVLKHPKSKKICLNVSNAHLKVGGVIFSRLIRGTGVSGLTQFMHSLFKTVHGFT